MRRIGRRIAWAMSCFVLTGAGAAQAQGDPEQGEKVFNKCKAYHAADEAKNRIGPHLVGIFGRTAGSVEGFAYSDAMKSAGIAGRTTPSRPTSRTRGAMFPATGWPSLASKTTMT